MSDADVWQGADILGLALGGDPSASNLDEYVEFEIFYDGAREAAKRGEAAPFLQARLCEAFEILDVELQRYLWQRDRFVLEVAEAEAEAEPRLLGHMRTGDGAEDEWFVVHLLRRLSAARGDVSCRVVDSDGELLLIEAALAAPRWITPSNAARRCWIRGGVVHLLPRPRPPEPEELPLQAALQRLRASAPASASAFAPASASASADGQGQGQGQGTLAKPAVQRAIEQRLEGYPKKALELSSHVARAVLPLSVARALVAYPQLVAVAVDHLPPPPPRELQRLRRQLEGAEADVAFDCEAAAEETACVGVRFTRCHYAWLMGLRCQLPQRFTQKHWRQPSSKAEEKAMQLGAKLCAGLEAAYLQGTKSATMALRWPSSKVDAKLVLPAELPWSSNPAFARQRLASAGPDPASASASASQAARRAYLQQSQLDEPFRAALLQVLKSSALAERVELADFWRDADDADDWLNVSAEDLDKEMMARQAEFDAYDRKRASKKSQGGQGSQGGPEQLKADLAALGQQLSGLLTRDSSHEGVDARGGAGAAGAAGASTGSTGSGGGDDDSSDESASEELNVLGMEEGEGSGSGSGSEESGDEAETDRPDRADGLDTAGGAASFREYLSELDEQLGSELDAPAPAADAADGADVSAAAAAAGGDGLPLRSHHIRVHESGPMDLDIHAMEHVLASFCSEHQLSPGPASLLLGELGLGLTREGATEAAIPTSPSFLSAMD